MLENQHVRSQHIATAIAKDGTTTAKLVIETDAEPTESDFEELVEAVVEYINARDDLESAEINCRNAVAISSTTARPDRLDAAPRMAIDEGFHDGGDLIQPRAPVSSVEGLEEIERLLREPSRGL